MSREGTRVGRWVALRPLGEGGGGSVWYAEAQGEAAPDPRASDLERFPVAIKFYPSLRASREEFRKEAAVALRNRHPNLLRLIDAGVLEDETPWLALEYLEGEDLRVRLERTPALSGRPSVSSAGRTAPAPLPPEDAARIGMQVFAALDAMHRSGLAHGDVKPENVLLLGVGELAVPEPPGGSGGVVPPQSSVRLVDFGRARLHHLYGDAEVFPGTPPYMHPTLFHGGAPTPLTDCFAAWVMLHECLSGARPFTQRQLSDPPGGSAAPSEVRRALAMRRALADPVLDRLVEAGLCGDLADARAGWLALARYLHGQDDVPQPLRPTPDPPADRVERALLLATSGVPVALVGDVQVASRALEMIHRGWALRGGTVLWARAGWGSPDAPLSGALALPSHAADGVSDSALGRIADELGTRGRVLAAASPSTRAWLDVLPSAPRGRSEEPAGFALAAAAGELDLALRAFCASCPRPLLLLVEGLDRIDGSSRRFFAGLNLPGVVVIGSASTGAPHGLSREIAVPEGDLPPVDLAWLDAAGASIFLTAVVLGLPYGPVLAVAAGLPETVIERAALEAEACGVAFWTGVQVVPRAYGPVPEADVRRIAREAALRLDAAQNPLLVARYACLGADPDRLAIVLDAAVAEALRLDPAVALELLLAAPDAGSAQRLLQTFHVAVLARQMEVASALLVKIQGDRSLTDADRAEAEAEFAFRTGQIVPALHAYRRVAAGLGRPLHDGLRGVLQDIVALWRVWRETPPRPRPDARLARVFERLHDLHFTSDNGPMLRIHSLWRAAAPAEPRVVAMDVVWNVALGRKARAMRVHEALWRDVSEPDDPTGAAVILLHRSIARSWTGEVALAYVDALDAAERLLRVGDPYLAALAVGTLSVCAFHLGEAGPLRRVNQRLAMLVRDTGDVRSGGWVMAVRAQLAWQEGRQHDAIELARQWIAEAQVREDSTGVLARRFLGELLLEEGHHVEATEVLLKGWTERKRFHMQMDFTDALAIDLLIADGQARVAGGSGLSMRWRYANTVAFLVRRSPRWASRARVAYAWQALARKHAERATRLFEEAHTLALEGSLYSDAWWALQHAALPPGADAAERIERAMLFAKSHSIRVPLEGEPDAHAPRR